MGVGNYDFSLAIGEGRVVSVENGRMANGEVFHADARRDLVMDDAVDDTGENRENDNSERLHEAGSNGFALPLALVASGSGRACR